MKKRIFLIIACLILASLACGQFTVVNPEATEAVIRVTLPDEAYGVRTLPAGSSASWYAFTGGTYTVHVMQSEAYLNFLKEQRDLVTDLLLNERTVEKPSQMMLAVHFFAGTQTRLDEIANNQALCSGNIPVGSMDIFDAEATTDDVMVRLKLDSQTGGWSCGE